jgi:hypothetical protein
MGYSPDQRLAYERLLWRLEGRGVRPRVKVEEERESGDGEDVPEESS